MDREKSIQNQDEDLLVSKLLEDIYLKISQAKEKNYVNFKYCILDSEYINFNSKIDTIFIKLIKILRKQYKNLISYHNRKLFVITFDDE